MKPARILLLVVAVVAGGLAAFMATRGSTTKQQVARTEIVQEARTQVMVAARPIGIGDRLNADVLKWQDWPESAVRPEFITSDMAPDAEEQLSGAVARYVFFEGEPIREAKLARSDQGFLSAVIEPGMRAVSIGITSENGAGGFIVPNDRVDVVLTSNSPVGERSETILFNVKVLIIDSRFGSTAGSDKDNEDNGSRAFLNSTIAVLELDPEQSEAIVNASEIGSLALVLRSVADFGEQASDYGMKRANSEIRVIRYGQETNIVSGGGSEMPPTAQRANFIPAGDPVGGQLYDPGDFDPDFGPEGPYANAPAQ